MNITRLAVTRPVGTVTVAFTLLFFGAIAFFGLGLDFLPQMEIPYIAIVTVYPGADPETIESTVTIPFEDALATVPGVRHLNSTSVENMSFIIAEFDPKTDIDEANRQVESQLNVIHRFLPDQVERPVVVQTDPDQLPIMIVAVTEKESTEIDTLQTEGFNEQFDTNSNLGQAASITQLLETRVKYELEQISGVAGVHIFGQVQNEVLVEYDSDRLHQYGITPLLLGQIIATQNAIVPAGSIEQNDQRLSIRAGYMFHTLDSLRNQTVSMEQPEGPGIGFLGLATAMPIRLRDVADVRIAPAPKEGITRVNQSPSVVLQIVKQSGTNSVDVAAAVSERLGLLEEDDDLGLTFHTLTNQTDLIGISLSNLTSAGITGGVLAVAVLLFFLKNVGAILVIGLAIPLSVIVTLIILHVSGTSLNMMSLGGIALSVGMLVDNAIVVLENIYRRRQMGESPVEAAILGGTQIGPAIFAATLTTLVVFIPLLFLKSLAGMLFKDTAISVTAALVASLFVALTIVPTATAYFVRRNRKHRHIDTATAVTTDADVTSTKPSDPVSRPEKAYTRALVFWTSRPAPTFILLFLLAALIVWIPTTLESQFLPYSDGGIVTAHYTLPPGTTIAQSDQFAAYVENEILSYPEVETVFTIAGDQGSREFTAQLQSPNPDQIEIVTVLRPSGERSATSADIGDRIRRIPRDPAISLKIESDRTTAALGDDFFPGLTVQISGPDREQIQSIAENVMDRIEHDNRFHNTTSNLRDGAPELNFRVTERSFQGVRAGGEPLTAGYVGLALRQHLTGNTVTHMTIDGYNLPVVLRPQPSETKGIDSIESFRVPGSQMTLGGGASPLIFGRIAEATEGKGSTALYRTNRAPSGTIQADLNGIGLVEAKQIAQKMIDNMDLPSGYSVTIAGLHQMIQQSTGELIRILIIAAFLVYAVMAIQFESFLQPLIIMITVPLAAVGGLTALKIAGHPIGVTAYIGFLFLIGISVNHGIIMIDLMNEKRREGLSRQEAVLTGAATRLRPILMTSLTTILGLLPMALGYGEGSELLAPLAVAILGGMISSTVLTLFVVPGLLYRMRFKADGPSI